MTHTEQAQEVNFRDVVTYTARLAQIMAEEVDLLDTMKVSKIETLQKEKLFLIGSLETQKKLLKKNPEAKKYMSAQDEKDMRDVVRIFNDIMEENHRKLLLAKSVNHKIVEAITDVVKETTMSRAYGKHGTNGAAPYETLSVTLDKKI